jgi:hypothetical protein
MNLKFLSMTSLLLLAGSLQAAILVEPLIGQSFSSRIGDEGGSGLSYGAHLGYQSDGGFQVGLDYLKSSIQLKDETVWNNKIDMTETGAFIGYKTDIFKLYLGYIFSASADTKVIDGQKVAFEKGSGRKIGVGFTGFKYVHINLEYRYGKFDDIKLSGVSYGDDKYSSMLLSLSIPITL